MCRLTKIRVSLALLAAMGLFVVCQGQMPDIPTGGYDKRAITKGLAKMCDDDFMTDDRLQRLKACGQGTDLGVRSKELLSTLIFSLHNQIVDFCLNDLFLPW